MREGDNRVQRSHNGGNTRCDGRESWAILRKREVQHVQTNDTEWFIFEARITSRESGSERIE